MWLCVHVCSWVGRCTCMYMSTYTNVCKTRGQLPVLFFMNTLSGDRSLTERALTVLTRLAGLHVFRSLLSPLPQPWSYKLAPLYPEFLRGSRVQGTEPPACFDKHFTSWVNSASWDISDDHINLIILILVHCKLQAGTEVFHSRTFCRTPNPMILASWHGYWTDLWARVPRATFP